MSHLKIIQPHQTSTFTSMLAILPFILYRTRSPFCEVVPWPALESSLPSLCETAPQLLCSLNNKQVKKYFVYSQKHLLNSVWDHQMLTEASKVPLLAATMSINSWPKASVHTKFLLVRGRWGEQLLNFFYTGPAQPNLTSLTFFCQLLYKMCVLKVSFGGL